MKASSIGDTSLRTFSCLISASRFSFGSLSRLPDRLTGDFHFPSAIQESNGSKWYISGYCPWPVIRANYREAWY
jgi:hypothetical protein